MVAKHVSNKNDTPAPREMMMMPPHAGTQWDHSHNKQGWLAVGMQEGHFY